MSEEKEPDSENSAAEKISVTEIPSDGKKAVTADQQELSNIEKYNLKKKQEVEEAKDKEIKDKDKKSKAFLKEAVEARKAHAAPYVLALIQNLDLESQLQVLKTHDSNRQDPNRSSLPTPIGREQEGLERFMSYNTAKDSIEWSIPASELMSWDSKWGFNIPNKEIIGKKEK